MSSVNLIFGEFEVGANWSWSLYHLVIMASGDLISLGKKDTGD
jgi:hypothetical protein